MPTTQYMTLNELIASLTALRDEGTIGGNTPVYTVDIDGQSFESLIVVRDGAIVIGNVEASGEVVAIIPEAL